MEYLSAVRRYVRQNALPTLKRHRVLIIICVAILAIGTVYVSGFRVGPGLTIARVGTLQLSPIPDGSQVFIDYGLRGVATGGSFPAALMPGNHSVIVSTPDRYPWEEIVPIVSNHTTPVAPVLVKKAVPKMRLSDEARKLAMATIASTTLPTEIAPLSTGCIQLSVSDNRLIANAATTTPACSKIPYICTDGTCSPTIVYAPADTLKAVYLYPGHKDAVIVQVGDHLYVIEIDPRSPQFFAPLYEGIKLGSGMENSGKLVVSDDGLIYTLNI